MIERACKRSQTVARYAAIGGGNAGDSAERRGLADGSAGIGSKREHRGALRDRRRGASARSTRHTIRRDGIPHRAKCRILVGRAHSELVAVGLAENHAARLLQADDRGRIVGRNVVGKQARGAGGPETARHDDVLHRDRNTGERAGIFAGRNPAVDFARRAERTLRGKRKICVGLRILGLGVSQCLARQLLGAELFRKQSGADRIDGMRAQAHRSITLGTLK